VLDNYVIAKYIRLSIEDSKSDSMSIENQRLLLDLHISSMGLNGAKILEFVDNGHSGTNFERPAVQELLELARQGAVNCIVVKDFSRFGRNAIDTGYFIERVFPLLGLRFISVSDYFDSDEHKGDTGGLEVSFKFLMHEYYSRDLSKKIKSAKHEKMRRGEYIMKNCAFGYKKVGKNLEIDEPDAETVRRIFALASEGMSIRKIAEALKFEKQPADIRKILSDEQYIGTYVAGKTRTLEPGGASVKVDESEWYKLPDHHPAIIDKAVFEAVRGRYKSKTPRKNGGVKRHIVRTIASSEPIIKTVSKQRSNVDQRLYERFVSGEISAAEYKALSVEA
jgi:DNA invertase Pin-like site-specific DNA recombinase